MAAALRPQDWQRGADDFQRAEEVRVEIPGDLLRAEFLQRADESVSRVVYHDIEPPKILHRLSDHPLHLRRIRDIQRQRAAGLGKLRGECAESIDIPRRGHDPLPAREQRGRQRRTEAAGATGDQPDAR